MEPFSIACTTCQARLRVRDETVIGQILTCPKCGSMVLVEPVAARSPDLTETVEDIAVQAEMRPAPLEHNFESEVDSDWRREPVDTDESDEDVSAELSPPPRPAFDEVLLPNADWTSASTVQWRNRILTGIAAVTGVVLAGLLVIAFSGGDEPPTVVSRPTSETSANGATESQSPETRAEEEVTTSDTPEPHTEAVPDSASPDRMPADFASEDSTELPADGPAELPVSDANSSKAVSIGPQPDAAAATTNEPPGLTPQDPPPGATPTDTERSPLAETLREFGALLDETSETASPTPAVDAELPPAPDSDDAEGEPVARRTGPRVVELDDRLNDPVAQIEFDGVPLANFLRFVSDYSTIPITLDADALRWTRVSPLTPVKLKATNSTVADILSQGLAPLGLEHRVDGDQLFVTRQPKEESGIRTVTFKVEDLVGDDAQQLQQLGSWIMEFVEPESWSSREGIGTITFRGNELLIEQYETVQFEILAFCEKLRVARGLKTRSPFDASQFDLATRGERIRPQLAQSITLTYIRPALLQRILDRIAQTSKLQILIDWRALGEAGWSPDAEVRFSVADQPLAKALTTLLEPMELTYRVVDESTLQITTPAVLDARLEIEFYRIAKLDDDGEKLAQAAREALGPENFRGFGGVGQLAIDLPSNCLLASLSQTQQRELEVWLAAQAAVLARRP